MLKAARLCLASTLLLALTACGEQEVKPELQAGKPTLTEVIVVDAGVSGRGSGLDPAKPTRLTSEVEASAAFAGWSNEQALYSAYEKLAEESNGTVWAQKVSEGCFMPTSVEAKIVGDTVAFRAVMDKKEMQVNCFRSMPAVALVGVRN